MKKHLLVLLVLFAILSPLTADVVEIVDNPIFGQFLPHYKTLMTDAFKEAGHTLTFKSVPLARGNEMLALGTIDGTLGGADHLEEVPNLVSVDVPIHKSVYYPYVRKDVTITGLGDFRGKTLAGLRGSDVFEVLKQNLGCNVIYLDSPEAIGKFVKSGRADFFIHILGAGEAMIDAIDAHDIIGRVDAPFFSTESYVLLQKEKSHVRDDLHPVLQRLAEEGAFNY